jgi:hypothetical protein
MLGEKNGLPITIENLLDEENSFQTTTENLFGEKKRL